jgi:hypothetical protein
VLVAWRTGPGKVDPWLVPLAGSEASRRNIRQEETIITSQCDYAV